MNPFIKRMCKLFAPYDLEVEEQIYYFCYSNKSGYKIKGYEPDDLAQELFLKTLKIFAGGKYNPNKPFTPFLSTAYKRYLIDLWRKVERSKDMYDKLDKLEIRESD